LRRPADADHLVGGVFEEQVHEVLPGERIRPEDDDLVHATFRVVTPLRTAASAARALASCPALRASRSAGVALNARRLPPTGRNSFNRMHTHFTRYTGKSRLARAKWAAGSGSAAATARANRSKASAGAGTSGWQKKSQMSFAGSSHPAYSK